MLFLFCFSVLLSLVSAARNPSLSDLPSDLLEQIADTPGALLSIRDLANLKLTTKALNSSIDLLKAKRVRKQFGITTRKPRTAFNALLHLLKLNNSQIFADTFTIVDSFPLRARINLSKEYFLALVMSAVRLEKTHAIRFLLNRTVERSVLEKAYYYAINFGLEKSKQALMPLVTFPVNEARQLTMAGHQTLFMFMHRQVVTNCSDYASVLNKFLDDNTIDINAFLPIENTSRQGSPLIFALYCSDFNLARRVISKGIDITYRAMEPIVIDSVRFKALDAASVLVLFGQDQFLRELFNMGVYIPPKVAGHLFGYLPRFKSYRKLLHVFMDMRISGAPLRTQLIDGLKYYIKGGLVDHFTANLEFLYNLRLPANKSASLFCKNKHTGSEVREILKSLNEYYSPENQEREPKVDSILHLAAMGDNTEMMNIILDCGFSPDLRHENSTTALEYAVISNKLAVARVLVKRGASMDIAIHSRLLQRQFPLLGIGIIEANVDYEFAEFLLQYGNLLANNKHSPEYANLCYQIFSLAGSERLKLLFLKYGADINAVGAFGVRSLHHLVKEDRIHDVKFLLDHGADIESKNAIGATSLNMAIGLGKSELLKVLISRGADVHSKNNNGDGPFHKLFRSFTMHLDNPPKNLTAIRKEHIKLLIDAGADIRELNNRGETVLHSIVYSSGRGKVTTNAASFLIQEHGFDVNVKDGQGATPLHHASKIGGIGMIKHLISLGALVDAKTDNDVTPLHSAINYIEFNAADTLIKNGASLYVKDKQGKNAFAHFIEAAADSKSNSFPSLKKFIDLFKKHDIDLMQRDSEGNTILHMLAKDSHAHRREAFEYLVTDVGLDIDVSNNELQTPLHIAAANKNEKLIRFLVDKDANAAAFDVNDKTPYDLIESLLNSRSKKDAELASILQP